MFPRDGKHHSFSRLREESQGAFMSVYEADAEDGSDGRGAAGGLRTGRSQIQLYPCDHLEQQMVVDPLTCR